MGQQDRLGSLRVSLTRHDGLRVSLRLGSQRVDQLGDLDGDVADRVADPHAEHRSHLVIARTSRAQATADLRANPVDQAALHRAVDVLVGGCGYEGTVRDVPTQLVKPVQHGLQVGVGEESGPVQNLRVRLRGEHVIGGEHPVEVGRHGQRKHGLRRVAGKAAAPERALVRAVLVQRTGVGRTVICH